MACNLNWKDIGQWKYDKGNKVHIIIVATLYDLFFFHKYAKTNIFNCYKVGQSNVVYYNNIMKVT